MSAPAPAPSSSAPPRRLLLLAFAAIFLVWGTTFLAIRYAVETIPPLITAGVRHGVAGTVLFALAWLRGYRPRRADWIAGSVLGALFFLAGHGLLHWAELHIASGLAALLIATEPLWILALGAALGRQRLNWANGLGLLLGLAGVALLTLPELGAVHLVDWAIFATLLSSLAWSLGVVAGPLLKFPEHALGRAAVATLAGGAMLLLLAGLTGEFTAFEPGAVSLRSALGLAYLISFGSVITFSAYTWLLQHVPPTLVATHTFVNPVVAILAGWMWAGEPLGGQLVLAAVVIVLAVVLVQRGERGRARLLLDRLHGGRHAVCVQGRRPRVPPPDRQRGHGAHHRPGGSCTTTVLHCRRCRRRSGACTTPTPNTSPSRRRARSAMSSSTARSMRWPGGRPTTPRSPRP